MNSHLLRPKQAADWLGVSLSTFYKRVKQGLIPPAAYRHGNSVAWDTKDLQASSILNKTDNRPIVVLHKEQFMPLTDTHLVAPHVLNDLLANKVITRSSMQHYSQYGANTHLPLIMRYLRKVYGVIIHYSPKNGGVWFMKHEDSTEYLVAPKLHTARKERMDNERSQQRLNNNILNIAQKHKYEVIEHIYPEFFAKHLSQQSRNIKR